MDASKTAGTFRSILISKDFLGGVYMDVTLESWEVYSFWGYCDINIPELVTVYITTQSHPIKLASHWAISFQHRANCGQPPQLPAIWLLTCAPWLGGEQLDTSGANTNFVNKDGRPRCKSTFCRRFSSIYTGFIVFTFYYSKECGPLQCYETIQMSFLRIPRLKEASGIWSNRTLIHEFPELAVAGVTANKCL